ncbi:hypothetical protein ZIOFF_001694 [Zingiber officinale]|uniref:AIPP2-like SPOC-like domain-containing protein n=1 Tax=Zingiber officinale TaxID=94328 RepID=A0A8J5HV72_ZINOF|nr:hypothetical protein ZIOFF_001694 [Zingiber officinale]
MLLQGGGVVSVGYKEKERRKSQESRLASLGALAVAAESFSGDNEEGQCEYVKGDFKNYCMKVVRFGVRDNWYCDECSNLSVDVAQESKMPHTVMESNSKAFHPLLNRVPPTKGSSNLNDQRIPKEIDDSRKWRNRKHVKHSSIPMGFYKAIQNAKVKFISTEEVCFTKHPKISFKASNSGPSSCRRSYAATLHPSSRKEVKDPYTSSSLTKPGVFKQPNAATVYSGLLAGNVSTTRDAVIVDKEANMRKKVPVSAALGVASDDSASYTANRMGNKIKLKALDFIQVDILINICKLLGACLAAAVRTTILDVRMDWSMIIILVTLLCVLINTLGLNFVVRCTVHWCGRQLAFETSEESAMWLALTSGGVFEVFGMAINVFDEIEAHFPCQVSYKVYDISKKMPFKLKLNLLPRRDAWPFQSDIPTCYDIGLYFFVGQFDRPSNKYFWLLEQVGSKDFVMQSCLGEVELLIYPSTQLRLDSQRIDGQPYFWGVFRRKKLRKPADIANVCHEAPQEQSSACSTSLAPFL